MTAQDLIADYQQAGFSQRLGFGKRPALIIIDLVQVCTDPASPYRGSAGAAFDSAFEASLRLRELAHEHGVFTVLTNALFTPEELRGNLMARKAPLGELFGVDAHWARWPERLTPRPGELVVTKPYPSAFFGTDLATTLRVLGIDSVILTGASTSGCVRATCLDAMCHGFIPNVVREACADRDARPHESNLFDMNAKYADVVSEAEVTSYLRGFPLAGAK